MRSAVHVRGALVPVLAPVPIVAFVTLASAGIVAAVTGARLLEVLARPYVNVGTRPEPVIARPFVGLPQQTQRAVLAHVVLGQSDRERLSRGIVANELRTGHVGGQIQQRPLQEVQNLKPEASLKLFDTDY